MQQKTIQFKSDEAIKMATSYYSLQLGRSFTLNDGTEIKRVPGGWMHVIWANSGVTTSTFVPYSDEFIDLTNSS
jgi:hypothetical protein